MLSSLSDISDSITPLIWWGLDILWLLVGVILIIKVKKKAALVFLIAASLSSILSTFNLLDTYFYYFTPNREGLISWEENWQFLVFDYGWASLYFTMIISISLIIFRIGVLTQRNRELESILSTRQESPSPPHPQD